MTLSKDLACQNFLKFLVIFKTQCLSFVPGGAEILPHSFKGILSFRIALKHTGARSGSTKWIHLHAKSGYGNRIYLPLTLNVLCTFVCQSCHDILKQMIS